MTDSSKRHCFSEEDGWISSTNHGYYGHNYSHHNQHGFVSRTLSFGTSYNRDFRSPFILSPGFGRFYDAIFEDHQPYFLQACFLCKRPLGDRDIFMYRFNLQNSSSYTMLINFSFLFSRFLSNNNNKQQRLTLFTSHGFHCRHHLHFRPHNPQHHLRPSKSIQLPCVVV
ncbi:hypothetical protein V8G54_006308 [Vigna mungo]|uniref:FLZ-type domain-containing protein n=1 Tax=Vigna mungo TaxID=3915 RepID=A0AAQ3NYR8_VIGMU